MTLDQFQQSQFRGLMRALLGFWKRRASNRVHDRLGPANDVDALQRLLREPLPRKSQPLEVLCQEIERVVVPNSTNSAHPLYLAYVTPPAVDISVLADAVTAILNQNVSLAHLAPAGTVLEQTAVRWLSEIVGYGPEAGGLVVDGGSMANLYGLALARRRALGPQFEAEGHHVDLRRQRIYCSEDIHRSVQKAAMCLGIGTENVRCIPVDNRGAVRIDVMESTIQQDLQCPDRYLPTTIVGAAGTRVKGAFDDLKALASLASTYGVWLHVDGAFGAFLKVAAAPPAELEHLHLADSITLDPHKLMFLSFDAGCFLVRRQGDLAATFAESGEALDRSPMHTNYMDLGIQLSRSMKGLKLWMALKHIGADGYSRELTRLMDLARYLEHLIVAESAFELLSAATSVIVCFRWVGDAPCSEELRNGVNAEIPGVLRNQGLAYVNTVHLGRLNAIRVCMINFRTTESDLRQLMGGLRQTAQRLATSLAQANPSPSPPDDCEHW